MSSIRKEMSMKIKYIVLAILLIGSMAGGYYYYSSVNAEEVVETTVNEITVKNGDLRIDFLADGSVVIPVVDLKSQSPGILKEIYFEVGDTIKAGDLLGILDDSELQFKMAQSLLAIDSIEAKLEEENLKEAQDINYQEAVIEYLEKDIETAKVKLTEMQSFELVYTVADLEEQEENIAELEERLELENLKLMALQTNSDTQDLLDIEDLKIDIALLEKEIENTKIYAALTGTVIEVAASVNSNVNVGNVLLTLQQQEEKYLSAVVSEMDIHQVSLGQKVLAEFESSFGVPFEGVVSYINPVPKIDNNGIVSYEVRIVMDKYPENVLSGLTSFLSFILKEREDVLMIPNSTVSIQDSKQMVELKTEEGSVMQPIVTGLTDGVNVEVLDGLNAGDIILTRSSGK